MKNLRKNMKKIFVSTMIAFLLLLTGCATNLPMTSSLNNFVMMGTKTNNKANISFKYDSKISDGLLKPYDKDKSKLVSGHPGYNQTESSTLGRMLNEYMENKFVNISPNGKTKVKVTLKDFYIEQYSTDSGGKQVLVAFAGGEINMLCVAKVKVLLTVTKNGEEQAKIISASSDENYISGIGTGTSTSNVHRGKDSIQHTHASNINKVNNKVIMMINAYFEEIGL